MFTTIANRPQNLGLNFKLIGVYGLLSLFFSSEVFAWGGRGHHVICSTAVHLVKNQELKSFLMQRPQTLGHLCNIPDIYWKSLGSSVSELGSPAHHIDPEVIGLKIQDIPTDFKLIEKEYTGKTNQFLKDKNIFSIAREMGSLWWRAQQFFELMTGLNSSFTKVELPKNYKEAQDEKLPFNDATYKFMVNAGLIGHFIGDASQPYHSSADFDGWASGHGGIHAYYEEIIVSQFGPEIENEIFKLANRLSKKEIDFLNAPTFIERIKKLSVISFEEIDVIKKKDPIIKESIVKKEKGMELRTAAERKPAAEGFKIFKKMILKDMTRSALLLAHTWDDAYVKIGSPKISAYKNYRYPLTPDFVELNYTLNKSEVKPEIKAEVKSEKQ